jgi:hypothetical protein
MYKFVTCVHGTTVMSHKVNARIRQVQTNHMILKNKFAGRTWLKAGNKGSDGWMEQPSAEVPTHQVRNNKETSNTMRFHVDVFDSSTRGVSGMASS